MIVMPCRARWAARLLMLGAVVSAAVAESSVAAAAPADRPPNVVLMYADDLGYGDLGCYGASGYQTPHLDRLAREGVRSTDFYVAQAVCSASRAALLTGCYPNRVGIQGALGPQSKHGIHDDETTLAEVLRSRGYATAIYGKWHLGHHPQFLPTRHGFDAYFGLPYSNDMWPKHPAGRQLFPDDLPLIEGDRVVARDPDQRLLTTWYTERAVAFIEQHRQQPFFVYVPHAMPHVPLHVSEKFAGKTARGLFGDVIEEIDWSMGQILDTLQRLELDDDTLVIFASDNGPWLTYGDHAGTAGPLREGKGTAWDGGVRVPCLARWPGRLPAGRECREPWMTIDVLPTLARLAGATLPAERPIDGRDAWPILAGQPGAAPPHEALFFWWGLDLHAVRAGRWKLHFPHKYAHPLEPRGTDGLPGKAEQRSTELALYDLETDVGESRNVAAEHPDVVARLTALADAARAELGDASRKIRGTGVRAAGQLREPNAE